MASRDERYPQRNRNTWQSNHFPRGASDAARETSQKDVGDTACANRRRRAKVWLYTRALEGMGAVSITLTVLLKRISTQLLKHWCIIVRFLDDEDDDRIWLCDFANTMQMASSGSSHPQAGARIDYTARPVSERELREGKVMERKFYLGTIQISENELKAACRAMKHNGEKYHTTTKNCQHCTEDLCSKLGLPSLFIPEEYLSFFYPKLARLVEFAGSVYSVVS